MYLFEQLFYPANWGVAHWLVVIGIIATVVSLFVSRAGGDSKVVVDRTTTTSEPTPAPAPRTVPPSTTVVETPRPLTASERLEGMGDRIRVRRKDDTVVVPETEAQKQERYQAEERRLNAESEAAEAQRRAADEAAQAQANAAAASRQSQAAQQAAANAQADANAASAASAAAQGAVTVPAGGTTDVVAAPQTVKPRRPRAPRVTPESKV